MVRVAAEPVEQVRGVRPAVVAVEAEGAVAPPLPPAAVVVIVVDP
jgi:hypothetical protein